MSKNPSATPTRPTSSVAGTSPASSYSLTAATVLPIIALGSLEHLSFLFAGVVDPEALHSQMQFKTMAMMKIFTAAMGGSMLSQVALNIYDPQAFVATRRARVVPMSRVISGCLILGIGTTLCGQGPSLFPACLVALKGSEYVVLGAVTGALLFSVAEKIGVFGPCNYIAKEDEKTVFLDKKLNTSYNKLATIVGSTLVASSVLIEVFWPHSKDAAFLNNKYAVLYPTITGLVLGGNQFGLRLLAGIGNGASTSVVSVVSTLSGGFLAPAANLVSSNAALAQFMYIWVAGLSSVFVCTRYVVPELKGLKSAYSPLRSFVGGLLSIFGSRVAQGCLCGLGVTGVAQLELSAFAGAASIFAGGMAAALFV